MEDVLGFCVLVLTMVGLLGIAVWLGCSILERLVKTRWHLKNPRYDFLLRENKRLKGFLADVEEENAHLIKEIYYSERIRRREGHVGRNVA